MYIFLLVLKSNDGAKLQITFYKALGKTQEKVAEGKINRTFPPSRICVGGNYDIYELVGNDGYSTLSGAI